MEANKTVFSDAEISSHSAFLAMVQQVDKSNALLREHISESQERMCSCFKMLQSIPHVQNDDYGGDMEMLDVASTVGEKADDAVGDDNSTDDTLMLEGDQGMQKRWTSQWEAFDSESVPDIISAMSNKELDPSRTYSCRCQEKKAGTKVCYIHAPVEQLCPHCKYRKPWIRCSIHNEHYHAICVTSEQNQNKKRADAKLLPDSGGAASSKKKCKHDKVLCEVCNPGRAYRQKMLHCMYEDTNYKKARANGDDDNSNKVGEKWLGCDEETLAQYFKAKVNYWNFTEKCRGGNRFLHEAYEDENGRVVERNFQIDHIKPRSEVGKHKTEEDARFYALEAIYHYTNAQPMHPEDNTKKSNLWSDAAEKFWRQNIYRKMYVDRFDPTNM